MPLDKDGNHICWICKQATASWITVIFKRLGFVEFICQACYDKPSIRDILEGARDTVAIGLGQMVNVIESRSSSASQDSPEGLEEFKQH